MQVFSSFPGLYIKSCLNIEGDPLAFQRLGSLFSSEGGLKFLQTGGEGACFCKKKGGMPPCSPLCAPTFIPQIDWNMGSILHEKDLMSIKRWQNWNSKAMQDFLCKGGSISIEVWYFHFSSLCTAQIFFSFFSSFSSSLLFVRNPLDICSLRRWSFRVPDFCLKNDPDDAFCSDFESYVSKQLKAYRSRNLSLFLPCKNNKRNKKPAADLDFYFQVWLE